MAVLTIANIVPMVGLTPPAAPTDIVVPLLVVVTTCLAGVVIFMLPHPDAGHGKAAMSCAVAGVLGVVAVALLPPYTPTRPKRLLAAHAADDSQSALLLAGYDPNGLRPLADRLTGATPTQGQWPNLNVFLPPFTHAWPAPPPNIPAPGAQVTASAYDAGTDQRKVSVHLDGGNPQLRLLVPSAGLLAWSLTPQLPPQPPMPGRYLVHLEGVPPEGMNIELTLRGWQPVEIELRAIGGAPADSAEVRALRERLPDWTSLTTYDYRITRTKI
jgi:hypothetical protein